MPIIDGEWVPPSQLIAEMGKEAYEEMFEKSTKRVRKTPLPPKKEEEVPSVPMTAREGFKFGADPECFIFDSSGKAVSAEGLIPGTKAEPYPVEHGAVQVDGMAAEFNIAPASTFKDFNRNIEAVIKQLTAMLPKGHTLQFIPSVQFDKDVFDAAPEKAKELGCQPDYNAWDGKVNPPPKDHENPYLRCAGGHIHLGWTEGADLSNQQHIMNCCDLVKQLDWYLGGWSVKHDTDTARRRLYGKAGACRLKDYGVEYRVLSNFWVATRERRLLVWNRMQSAIDAMVKGFLPDKAGHGYNQLLRQGIDTSEMSGAISGPYHYPLISLAQ